jgi:hypothetical protein
MREEEKQQARLLARVRGHLRRRGISHGVISGIMFVTALAGFLASVGMLKVGIGQMWLRYPLAVLLAWVVFLALVRGWTEVERSTMSADEELVGLESRGDDQAVESESVWKGRAPESRPDRWRGAANVLEFISHFLDFEGCLVLGAVVAVIALATGAAVAIGSMVMQAEALLAEVLLDALLVSALYHRLRKKELDWWTGGILRETIGPVFMIMGCLMIAGIAAHSYAPEAHSVGGVWHHWRKAP